MALGFLEEYQGTRPEQVVLSCGDVVILYTDGLVEARDANGQNYGLNRLEEIVAANTCLDAVELREVILNDLFTFTGCRQQRDDVTLVILKKDLERGVSVLEIKVNKEKEKATLLVAGELDYSNVAQLQQEIARQEAPVVEVVLKDLQFMDSSGAGMLLGQARLLSRQNRVLKITHIPANIRHDLEIIGFFRVLETLKGTPQSGGE